MAFMPRFLSPGTNLGCVHDCMTRSSLHEREPSTKEQISLLEWAAAAGIVEAEAV